ncbi:MAG: response regulator [bacterium]|nr:response regulator [bacterium]
MTETIKKILLIEDDNDQALMYKLPFELDGFDIMNEPGGVDGLAKAVGWHPDLILLDVLMEGMDGMEVLKQLKQNKHTKNIPVVMLTNISSSAKGEESEKLGAAGYFEKTKIMPKELVAKCKKVLGI